ncbi:MAG: class I SAM-dependent methyltransferase [Patescibacteria group bacterium]
MSENIWAGYYERTKDRPPRPLLIEATALVKDKNEALDLGPGALTDVKYLLSVGFNHVTAIDRNPVSKKDISDFPEEKVSYVTSSFEDFEFPKNKYDLINAQYSLPFSSPETFNKLIEDIIFSLKENGVFTGQFFGKNDEWTANEKSMTFHTRAEAEKLLSGLKIVSFEEVETDKKTAAGKMKHWHVFHFIAVK